MSRRVITAADVQSAAADGRAVLPVHPADLVTALARDEAVRLELRLIEDPHAGNGRTTSPVVPARPRAHHVAADTVRLEPFAFDVGHAEMDVRTTDVVTDAAGSPMAAGFMSLRQGAFPWSLTYDEIDYVIEGELHIGTPDGTLIGHPGDVLYLPRGIDITFGTPTWARFLYVTYPARWAAPGPADLGRGDPEAAGGTRPWDRPADFPVRPVTEPRCATCDGPVTTKPDHLTQIDARRFGPKTDPQVKLRGRLDGLQAQSLLVAGRARAAGHDDVARHLQTLGAYCRALLSSEYHNREAPPVTLAGVDEEALHAATHDPQKALGVPHLTPGPEDPELQHWLAVLRCEVRAAEIQALEAFPPEASSPERASLRHGLNRLSSAVYYLQLLLRSRPGPAVRGQR
jgi:ethanolamine utilization cobalamin adenosyltransferase